jgi:hypothetical protein
MSRLSVWRQRLITLGLMTGIVAGSVFYVQSQSPSDALAGVEQVGEAEGSNLRALLVNSNGSERVNRIIYFAAGNHLTGGANTPVASGPLCGNQVAGDIHYAEVRLSGTMAGTAPTLAIKWQNSVDGGATWSDIGTWTTINATVTPAVQKQTVADIYGATAVVYGDCWRVTYTMTGTGAAANFEIIGLEK